MAAIVPSGQDFRVRRDDLRVAEMFANDLPATGAPEPGSVLLAIDRFALTANNITYAAFGDRMKYWDFFPAPDGWGSIPVWGFADVVASAADGIAVGERFYGYFPMSSHLRVEAARVSPAGFVDGAAHRQALHVVYNTYVRTAADPAYDARFEDQQALLKPLFFTSFLIADFLADNQFFGAAAVVLSSASSKTAYGVAHELTRLPPPRCRVVGLTSARNRAFVAGLGCYDAVATYDGIAGLAKSEPVVYVDMSGNGAVRAALHNHFQDNMRYSCSVGGTHWEKLAGGSGLPGAKPALFFAPAQGKKRAADWGADGLQQRYGAAWASLVPKLDTWMHVVHARGPAAIEQTYRAVLDGRVDPADGHMLSF